MAHLANLFVDLQLREDPAITPALELAKLALVTSKDEEEDERAASPVILTAGASRRPGTNSSASTDATLVEDDVHIVPTSANSVLGKRPRRTKSAMDLDVDFANDKEERDGFVVVPRAGSEPHAMDTTEDTSKPVDGDAKPFIGPVGPPPLPPRKKSTLDDSGSMMFGKLLLLGRYS